MSGRGLDDYIPVDLFGRDHWSTLAYAETVMVDVGGFQIGADARMRHCRRNFRVMRQMCPKPRRIKSTGAMMMVMDHDKHGTRLSDGQVIAGHDDWHCIQDMAEAGFFMASGELITAEQCEPGVILHLSPLGREFSEELRAHKAGGGSFSDFKPKTRLRSPVIAPKPETAATSPDSQTP